MKKTLLGGAALSLLLTVPAFAADLAVPLAAYPAPSPPPFTWTSCYGGLRAGGGIGQSDLTDTAGVVSGISGFSTANLNLAGWMAGGQLGCDYQFAPSWVVGIEGAVTGGNISKTATIAVPLVAAGDTATYKATTDFLMSATVRVGYAWDRWMLYAKGGFAGAGNNYSAFDAFQTYNIQGTENRVGWTAGAGLEWAFREDLSVRLEYDYYGFGSNTATFIDSVSTTSGPVNIKQNIQLITLGVNFHAYAGP
jgi:opacity protein-like surface antigen